MTFLQVAIDLDLYALVDKSGTSKSAGELAAATGADPMLMGMDAVASTINRRAG